MEVTYTPPECPGGTVTIVLTEKEARDFTRDSPGGSLGKYTLLRDALRKQIRTALAA